MSGRKTSVDSVSMLSQGYGDGDYFTHGSIHSSIQSSPMSDHAVYRTGSQGSNLVRPHSPPPMEVVIECSEGTTSDFAVDDGDGRFSRTASQNKKHKSGDSTTSTFVQRSSSAVRRIRGASQLRSSRSSAFLSLAQGAGELAEFEIAPTIARHDTGMQRFREQFDPQVWSTFILKMHGSVFSAVAPRVLALTAFSLFVCLWDRFVISVPETTTVVHQIGGALLALFITFRTNSSYGRFYEGVNSFALMLTTLQAIARVLLTHGVTANGNAHGSVFICIALINAFPIAAKCELRGESSTDDLERIIGHDAIFKGFIRDSKNKPQAIFQAIGQEVMIMRSDGIIDSNSLMYLEDKLLVTSGLWSSCLKIAKVPVPYLFAIEGSRIVVIFLITLPWVIVPHLGFYTILAIALIAYEILAVEAASTELDDPLGTDDNDIPLDDLTVEHINNVAELTKGAHWRQSRAS